MNTQKNKKHRSRVASILSIILVGCIALTTALFSDRVATFISVIANYPSIDVTYDANGGYFDTVDNDLNIVTYEDGSVIKGEYKEPDHSSYYLRFDGWYTDQECTKGNEFDPDRDTLLRKENITVYAKWKDVRVNVIYDANGGHFENSSTNALEYVEGTHTDGTYEEPEHDTNYLAFAGWYTDKACSKGNEFDPATFNYAELTADKTVYAKWKKVPGLYQTGSEYTVLLKDWDTLIAEGLVVVTNGSMTKIDKSMAGDLLVAETVTGAAEHLLLKNEALTGITLPVNFKDLGMGAFNLAPALTHVRVDEDNTNFCSVDDNLYSEDKTVFYCYPIGKTATTFTVPDGVIAVEYAAFAHCPYLEKVTLPEGLEYIGYYSFASCEALEKVNIPDEVYYIDTEAFWGCKSLENVTFPDGLLYINYGAFSRCESFTEITLPASLEYLGNSAFESCSSLEKVTFEQGIKITALRDYTFRACTSLKEITVPEGVTSIGYKTFAECTSLAKITLPDTVKTIGQYAFPTPTDPPIAGTNGYWFSVSKWGVFTADEIPAEVAETYIAVNPANKVTYNPNGGMFTKGPRKEAGLYVPDTDKLVKTWDELVSGGIIKVEGTTITDTNLTLEGDLVIPEGITTIGMDAFENETKLIGVFMPESLTNIYSEGFDSCTNLKEVVLSNTITSIQSYAFKGCNELESIYIPESVTAINYNAFEGCTALADVYYSGTQTKWNSISVGENNESLTNADVTYDFDFNKINEVGYYKGTVTAGTYIEPTKKAHKFLGWYTDAECTDGKEFDPETDVAELDEDITVYAKWEQVYPVLQKWTSSATTDFHNSSYRSKITTAEIVDYMETPESPAAGPWDVSEKQNGSVMAWLTTEDDGATYHLTISGNDYGKVFANTDSSNAFYSFSKLTSLTGTDILELGGLIGDGNANDITTWKVKPVTNTGGMFSGCSKLATLEVGNWNVSFVTNMGGEATGESSYGAGPRLYQNGMFYGCSSITTLDVENWDVSSVTNMSSLFKNCSSLTTLDVSKWNTSNAVNMGSIFEGCSNLTLLDISTKEITLDNGEKYTAWDVSSVEEMEYLFSGCTKLATLDVSKWDTSSAVDMEGTFSNCSNLTILDVSNFITSNVLSLDSTFKKCTNLSTIDVSKWNTSQVKTMYHTFHSCTKLTDLGEGNVGKWKTGASENMAGMFYDCRVLPSLDVSEWDTSSVTAFGSPWGAVDSGMFQNCYQLTTLDVSKWDVSKAQCTVDMFNYCTGLKTLDVSQWKTDSLRKAERMFKNCGLAIIDISNWNLSNISSSDNTVEMFRNCSSLKELTIPATLKYIGKKFAAGCDNLIDITFLHSQNDDIKLPVAGGNGAFYVGGVYNANNLLMTNLTTENDTVKEYLWNTDNRGFPVNIIYNANGGKFGEEDSNTVKYNPQKKTVMDGTYADPTQGGKEFAGWYTDEDCTDGNEFDISTHEFDLSKNGQKINVYAKWENVPFTVTYDANGGNFGTDVTTNAVEYKGSAVITGEYKEPTRMAHEFLGWYTDAECSDGKEFNLSAASQDITVYAKWNPIYPVLQSWTSSATTDFHNSSYKSKITTVEFVDYMETPETPAAGPWDVSKDKNGSVMAWVTTEDDGATYHLTISGNGYGKIFANTDSSNLFINFHSLSSFKNADILETGGLKDLNDSWIIEPVKKTINMFNSTGLNAETYSMDISSWDLSYVTDAKAMFYKVGYNAKTFDLNLDSWDVSNLTTATNMFGYAGFKAETFTLDLSNWNVNSLEDASKMFANAGYNAKEWAVINLKNWNVSNLSNASKMFENVGNSTTGDFELDLSGWQPVNLVNANDMFYGVGKNAATWKISGIENWNLPNLQSASSMFKFAANSAETIELDLSKWEVPNLESAVSMFDQFGKKAKSLIINLSNWDTSKLKYTSWMFSTVAEAADTWKIIGIENWNLTSLENANGMFSSVGYNSPEFKLDLSKWKLPNLNRANEMFRNTGYYSTSWSIGDISNWEIKNLTDASKMFYYAGYKAKNFDIDLSNWNLENLKTASQMFYYAGSYADTWSVKGLNNKNLPNLTTAYQMFYFAATNGCKNSIVELDMSNLNAPKLTDASEMFLNFGRSTTKELNVNLSNWNVPLLSTTKKMFYYSGAVSSVFECDLSNWNAESLSNAEEMFCYAGQNASSWTIKGIADWDVSSLTNVYQMFREVGNNGIVCLDLSHWNVKNVTSYGNFNYGSETKIISPFFGDTTAPSLTVNNPDSSDSANPTIANADTYTVSGVVNDASGVEFVTVNSTKVDVNTVDGTWTVTITLADGETTTIEIIAEDYPGNTATETRYVRYDSTATLDLLPRNEMDNMAYWLSVVNQMMDGISEITIDSAITEMPMDVIDAVSYLDDPVTFIWNEQTFVIGLDTINDFEYVSGQLVSIADLATNYATIEEPVEDEVVDTESGESDVVDETAEDTEEDVINGTQSDTETEGEDVITEENGEEPVDPESSQPAEDTNPENSESEKDETENNNSTASEVSGETNGAPEEGASAGEPRTGENSRTSDIEGNPENTETEQPAVSPDENQDAGTEGEDTNVSEPEETEPATETDGNTQSVEEPTENNENSSDASEEGAIAEDSNFSEDVPVDLSLEEPNTEENRDYWQSIVNQVAEGTTEIILDNTVNEMPLEVIDALNQLETSVKFTWNDQVIVINQETINDFADFTNENVLISDLAVNYAFVEENPVAEEQPEAEETETPSEQNNVESTVSPDESQDEGSKGEVTNETEPVETELPPEIVENTETVNEAA